MADPNSLVLNQILSELQKLNDFERQSQRDARSIMQVARADTQTPVSPNLIRQTGPGAQMAGGLSANASTPDLLDKDALNQVTRQQLGQAANARIGGQQGNEDEALARKPRSEEAVAWSLLSEAGHGGALGRLRQAQYSVSRNLGVIGDLAGDNGPIAGWQNRLGAAADSSTSSATGAVLSGASRALQPLRTAGGWAQNLVDNHEMATTIGSLAVASGRRAANQWYEMGAAMGFDPTTFGGPLGAGQSTVVNRQVTHAGEQVWQLIQQLKYSAGGAGRGLKSADAQALVGQLFEQGFTPGGTGFASGGNMGAIARAEAPAVHAMGQQGAEIAGSWNDALRSSNTTLSDLSQMLLQIPKAAHTAQLGLQRFNHSLQLVAQTITGMGGTATESMRMGLQFGQVNPGVDPANVAALASSPLVQGFALGQGVLPSGIGAMAGGQFGNVSQQAVLMAVNAMQGMAPRQQYMTLPDGTRVPLNTPQAAVFQQAASQFFPGMTPHDLRKIYNQARHPQRSAAIEQLQNVMGQQNMGMATGIEAIERGRVGISDWGQLTQQRRQQVLAAWNSGIAPFLHQAGMSATQIRQLNQVGNVNERIQMLNKMLPGAGGTGANQPGNAATVRVEIGLTPKAAQLVTASSLRDQAKRAQNAGGTALNRTLNSPLGQNPTYGGVPNVPNNIGYGGVPLGSTGSTSSFGGP